MSQTRPGSRSISGGRNPLGEVPRPNSNEHLEAFVSGIFSPEPHHFHGEANLSSAGRDFVLNCRISLPSSSSSHPTSSLTASLPLHRRRRTPPFLLIGATARLPPHQCPPPSTSEDLRGASGWVVVLGQIRDLNIISLKRLPTLSINKICVSVGLDYCGLGDLGC